MIREKKHTIFYVILFLSGISALIYQIVWIEKFGLVFGVLVYSTSAVLAAFMTGLAIGSYLFGKLADKRINHLKLFILLELGIGTFALLFPEFFKGLMNLYTSASNQFTDASFMIHLIRFSLSFIFLLIPTTLMGGIIPIVSKYIVSDLQYLGNRLSKLYAYNNLGAFLGVLLAGFILIRIYGLYITLYIAAGLNFFNAITLLLYNKFAEDKQQISEFQNESKTKQPTLNYDNISNISPKLLTIILWVFAIEGFTTLAYEVIWTRLFVSFAFDHSTYLYSTIIFSFIFGLFLGGMIISAFIDKISNHVVWLGLLEILIGITSLLILIIFMSLFPALVDMREHLTSWWALSFREYVVIFSFLFIPTILMGMTFPLVGKIYTDNTRVLGQRIGFVGFLDTIGSVAGSLAAGFLLIPVLGLKSSFILAVMINIIIGLRVINHYPFENSKKKNFITYASVSLTVILVLLLPGQTNFMSLINKDETQKLVYYKEGVEATVAVHQFPNGFYGMSVNGIKTAFTNKEDLRVHAMLAYLPYFAHPAADNAFVVGLGMGITVNSLATLNLKRVDVAEISPAVVQASKKIFHEINQDVFSKNNVNLIIEDGRGYLFSKKESYDIITTNAVHPRISPNLYTKEFYEICKNKLHDDGVICQWLPTNLMTENEFQSLIKAFIKVFPNTSLWYLNHGHTLLLGQNDTLNFNINRLEQLFQMPSVKRNTRLADIYNPGIFISMYVMGSRELSEYIHNAPVNTDNQPIVEYSRVVDVQPNIHILQNLMAHTPDYSQILTIDTSLAYKNKFHNYIQASRQTLVSEIQTSIDNVIYQLRD